MKLCPRYLQSSITLNVSILKFMGSHHVVSEVSMNILLYLLQLKCSQLFAGIQTIFEFFGKLSFPIREKLPKI